MLFDKVIVCADLHLGEKQNSKVHNEDCIEYLKWMVSIAKERCIDKLIFLGDWHHSRRSINVETLQYSHQGLTIISEYFSKIWFLEGNHDLFFRESRDVSSVSMVSAYKNIEIIHEPTVFKTPNGDVGMYPWLIEDEWKSLKNVSQKYVFGHFELPHFLLNAMIAMPDTGELSKDHFSNCSYVFSGHFHKRQIKDNVIYIGNCFPHNFNDVNDNDRGCMILEWDQEPEFINWQSAPAYRRWDINDIVNDKSILAGLTKIHAEVSYPENMTYAEACEIRESLQENYDFRTFKLKKIKNTEEHEGVEISESTVSSVDSIVIEQLKTIDSASYDPNLLISEYQSLDSDVDK